MRINAFRSTTTNSNLYSFHQDTIFHDHYKAFSHLDSIIPKDINQITTNFLLEFTNQQSNFGQLQEIYNLHKSMKELETLSIRVQTEKQVKELGQHMQNNLNQYNKLNKPFLLELQNRNDKRNDDTESIGPASDS